MKINDEQRKSYHEAIERLGDRADWELKVMRKALNMLPILNTDEDNQRLEDVKTVMRLRKQI